MWFPILIVIVNAFEQLSKERKKERKKEKQQQQQQQNTHNNNRKQKEKKKKKKERKRSLEIIAHRYIFSAAFSYSLLESQIERASIFIHLRAANIPL